jgi:hypothetical protein
MDLPDEPKTPDGAEGKKRVDESWKEEARREKERLAKEEAAEEHEEEQPEEQGGRGRGLPAPSMELIISNFAIQALIALGEVANPVTRRQERNLEQAKHAIDLLGILDEKTRGNLTDKEKSYLEGTLYDLRMRYVNQMR